MARTPSTMTLGPGDPAPDFVLPDAVGGGTVSRAGFAGKPLLVMFICNHCPFVVHVRDELTRLANDYLARGVAIVGINSNDVEGYPQDGPEHMTALAAELGWTFPYLLDEDQSVAKAFRAACTPDFFLFDAEHALVYRGQLDDSRPQTEIRVDGRDLRAALDAVLAGGDAPAEQKPSIGCNIKWKAGNEPEYFGR